jgi:hypothetical protein
MESSCWITFESDEALQSRIEGGYFTSEEGKVYLPISQFPAARNGYWICILKDWFREREIKFVDGDLHISAKVKKSQIEDFIEFAFAGHDSYSDPAKMLTWKGRAYLAHQLIDLRAFVAKELDPRIWYQIHADEF